MESLSQSFNKETKTLLFGNMLSPELWTLILKELSMISHIMWVQRLVCHRFNDILTPLLYQEMTFPASLASGEESSTGSLVRANIRAHTRRIVVNQEFNWDEVSELIRESRFLQDVEWCYIKGQFHALPTQIESVLRTEKPHVRLHINQQKFNGLPPQKFDVASIPASNLSSLCLAEFWDDVRRLQDFLISSTRLQSLDLCPHIRFLPGRPKLPPVKDLTIHAWVYTKHEVQEIWDLSSVERLKLVQVSMRKFVESLPPGSFINVKKLEYDENTTWVDMLQPLVERTDHLEELDVICITPKELIPGLGKHGDSLRVLKLRDLSGRRPQMDEESTREFLRLCPQLDTMTLDLDLSARAMDEEDPRLEVIASFKSLRRPRIRSQRDVHDNLDNRQCADFMKDCVVRQKCGIPLEQLVIVLRPRPKRLPIVATEYTYTWDLLRRESFREVITTAYR